MKRNKQAITTISIILLILLGLTYFHLFTEGGDTKTQKALSFTFTIFFPILVIIVSIFLGRFMVLHRIIGKIGIIDKSVWVDYARK